MIYRLSNQRARYKQIDQCDDGRTIAAISQKREFTCELVHMLFNDMAAAGERENQFLYRALLYRFGELEGVFKCVLYAKSFRVHSCLHRKNTKPNPIGPET